MITPVTPRLRELLIGAQWQASRTAKRFAKVDPRTEQEVATFAAGQAEDVDLAVLAARRAFDEGPWPRMESSARANILNKLGDLILDRADRLAELETWDTGKPLRLCRGGDIPMAASHFHYFADFAEKWKTEEGAFSGKRFAYTLERPIGVVGMILNWKFPLLMAAWKLAPALATGCTVVLKPSERTPMTALELGDIALEAGVPPGVLNVVTGTGEEAGANLAAHPLVDKIAFTGRFKTARKIRGKAVFYELGGTAPLIVFPDANPIDAADVAQSGVFSHHTGFSCASSRVYVHEGLYKQFIDCVLDNAHHHTVDDPFLDGVDQGPLVDKLHFDHALGYVDKAKRSGATVLIGGERSKDTGYYLQPTVLADCPDRLAIPARDIFGPVLAVAKWSQEDDVVARANAHLEPSCAAGICSDDVDTVRRVSAKLRAATVWVNAWNNFDMTSHFGGLSQSTFGPEKGEAALQPYLDKTTIAMPFSTAAASWGAS